MNTKFAQFAILLAALRANLGSEPLLEANLKPKIAKWWFTLNVLPCETGSIPKV